LNRINPLHLIILLLVSILFLFFQLTKIQSDLHEEEEAYKHSEQIAKELVAYKKFYGDKQRIKKSLKMILAQGSLKKAKIQTKESSRGITIMSKSIDLYALNSLMSKLFNGAYPIKNLQIKRIDNKNASLRLEIQW